ncbi:peptidoglycan-binding domain-containing protein [Streptomyces gardneri]|uniref:peptidoglycan-binding domain-containing protein n=1 Tax=Streptomyces gardneri TaxID=66892 RepID=UPI00369DA23D
MKRRLAALGMTVASIGALIGFAPAAGAADGPCTNSKKVQAGGYDVWVPATAGGSINCVLRQGDPYPSAIGSLQTALRFCNGHNSLSSDGHYGPLTASAVRLTQEFARIPVDGVYGPQTRAAMFWVVNDSSRTLCVKF